MSPYQVGQNAAGETEYTGSGQEMAEASGHIGCSEVSIKKTDTGFAVTKIYTPTSGRPDAAAMAPEAPLIVTTLPEVVSALTDAFGSSASPAAPPASMAAPSVDAAPY